MKIRPNPPSVVDMLIAIPEHSGAPYPEHHVRDGMVVVTWRRLGRYVKVLVDSRKTRIWLFDGEANYSDMTRVEDDLIGEVRDAIDWLRDVNLDLPPLPFPDDPTEGGASC